MPILTIDQFDYELPSELIAHTPASPRDHSRLLRLNRATGEISHYHFYDLPTLLGPDHVLVRNNTKVIPARLFGHKETGGAIEILLTKRVKGLPHGQGEVWECITRPGLKPGQKVTFANSPLVAVCEKLHLFARHIAFNQAGHELFASLNEIGHTPLPHYIKWHGDDEAELRQLYQTTYAKIAGSAAAPTAGLHFTPELDERLRSAGVQMEELTLHVGLGTFLRVKTEDVTQHTMHSEVFELKPEVAERLNQAKQAGKKIVSVGTTTTRVLESCAVWNQAGERFELAAKSSETAIYIYPPYQFKFVENLITNFHERKSTLLMLVSAFASQPNTSHEFSTFGETSVGKAYQAAVKEKYRLHSFGDAMLIE
jgi:S-adenosylmethionine:tRNA ribosyltransferase-isomerase